MPALCIHVSVMCPQFDEPIAQIRLDETITNAPPDLNAMGKIDWLATRQTLDDLLATVRERMVQQLADIEAYQEARRGEDDPDDEPDDSENGGG